MLYKVTYEQKVFFLPFKTTVLLDLSSDDLYNEARLKLTIKDAYHVDFGKAPKILNIEKALS